MSELTIGTLDPTDTGYNMAGGQTPYNVRRRLDSVTNKFVQVTAITEGITGDPDVGVTDESDNAGVIYRTNGDGKPVDPATGDSHRGSGYEDERGCD